MFQGFSSSPVRKEHTIFSLVVHTFAHVAKISDMVFQTTKQRHRY